MHVTESSWSGIGRVVQIRVEVPLQSCEHVHLNLEQWEGCRLRQRSIGTATYRAVVTAMCIGTAT